MTTHHRPKVQLRGPGHIWAAYCRDCGWSTSYGVGCLPSGTTRGHASWRVVRDRANSHYVERCGYDVFKTVLEPDALAELDY